MSQTKRRIQIDDLPQQTARALTEDDMKRITGGITLLTSTTTPLTSIKWDYTAPSLLSTVQLDGKGDDLYVFPK